MDDRAVPARRFGLAQGRGGHVFKLIVVCGDQVVGDGKPDADRGSNRFVLVRKHRPFDGVADTFPEDNCTFQIGLRRHHHKFFSADSTQAVFRSK